MPVVGPFGPISANFLKQAAFIPTGPARAGRRSPLTGKTALPAAPSPRRWWCTWTRTPARCFPGGVERVTASVRGSALNGAQASRRRGLKGKAPYDAHARTHSLPPPSASRVVRTSTVCNHRWGANTFYMPHSITVDNMGNVWVTDVGLHQVGAGTSLSPQTGCCTFKLRSVSYCVLNTNSHDQLCPCGCRPRMFAQQYLSPQIFHCGIHPFEYRHHLQHRRATHATLTCGFAAAVRCAGAQV